MKTKDDVSILGALLLLIIVLFSLSFLGNSNHEGRILENLDSLDKASWWLIIIWAVSLISNIVIVSSLAGRFFGFQKQGSRLRSIQGRRPIKMSIKILVFALTAYSCNYFIFLSNLVTSTLRHLLPGSGDVFTSSIYVIVHLNLFFSIYFISKLALKVFKKIKLILPSKKRLSSYPQKSNFLTLGSIGEEKGAHDFVDPQWVELGGRALNGNILITGSIGSGKTQGTILVFVEQLLKNFSPRPSMLILDPKGTFIPEVRTIANENGLSEIQK